MNKKAYLGARSISAFGDGIQSIAIIWFIYSFSNNSFLVGAIIAVAYVPSLLLSPFLGTFADLFNPKRLSILCDLVRAFVILAISISVVFIDKNDLLLVIIFIGQLLSSTFYTLYKSSSQKLIRSFFGKKEIQYLISTTSSASLVMTIAGSGLAGVMLDVISPVFCFLINSVSFFLSALCIYFLKPAPEQDITPLPVKRSEIFRHQLSDGFSYVQKNAGILFILFISIPSSGLLQGMNTLMAPYAKIAANAGSGLFALIDIAASLGGVVAGIILHKKNLIRNLSIKYGLLGIAFSACCLGLFRNRILSVAGFFLLGCFIMMHIISTQTITNLITEEEYLGRVVSIRTLVVSLVKIIFSLACGYLISRISPYNVFFILAAFSVIYDIVNRIGFQKYFTFVCNED